ncbi:MAG: hypothetical protein JWO82_891, partial [Akkermansiaceae bacterium]|nr:hypothetical protein [Akkermansiaceae bacterium]
GPAAAEHAADAVRRVTALARSSPNLRWDPEATARINEILAGLSAADLAELFSGIDALSDQTLASLVGRAWIAKDPAAALTALNAKAGPPPGWLATVTFLSWGLDEPATALGWLDSPGFPAALADQREKLRVSVLRMLAERDFALATDAVRKATPESAASVLQSWGGLYAEDPGMRSQLVDFAKTTGRAEDYAYLNVALLGRWPQGDAVGMLNYLVDLRGYLESGAVPAGSRPFVDGAAVAAAMMREYDRPALDWWMERHANEPAVPQPLREAISAWSEQHPDKALQWLAEQPASPQRDALATTTLPALFKLGKYPQAADQVAQIADATLKQQASQRLDASWSIADPGAAAQWRESLKGK